MPRSPGRDLADRLAGNRRYFRHWNPLEKWKLWLGAVALLLAVGWAAATFLTSKFDYQTTHGELASVHSAWNDKCEACHATPESSGVLDAQARWRTFTCQKCHAAPPHHATVKPEDIVNNDCSSCHYDHRGKNYSLVKLSDDKCVRCHRVLAANTNGSTQFANVTSFAGDHPMEIRSAKNHERHLKFSHSQHLTAGMVLSDGAKNVWKLSDIPENQRERYRSMADESTGVVKLECVACHTLESNPASRASGKYIQPINYDNHCKACHPTTVPPTVTEQKKVIEAFTIPHGKQLRELQELLELEFAGRLQKDHPELAKTQSMHNLRPSKDPAIASFKADVTAAASRANESVVKVTCLKCHDEELITNPTPTSNPPRPPDRSVIAKLIAQPRIPSIWMRSAKFDHSAHRAMDCKACHPNAVSKVENGNTVVSERESVNLPNLQSCRECHSPLGGVRHGCTDCHSFHNKDHPLQGRGAPAFVPNRPMTIEEFLKGK